MPQTTALDTPRTARMAAGLSAAAFAGASISWGSLATIGFWAPSQYRLVPQLRDVVPAIIAASMMLLAFQFARGVISPAHLPMGAGKRRPISIGRFGVRLATAALFGFMGFVLAGMAGAPAQYAIYDMHNEVVSAGDPLRGWMLVVQGFSGYALIVVSALAIVTHTRQFVVTRLSGETAATTASQPG